MKIEININEFYLEEEDQENIEKSLKQFIISSVRDSIYQSIKPKVENQIQMQVKEDVEKNMFRQMNIFIDEFIKTGLVKSTIKSNAEVMLQEYVKEKFTHGTGWNSAEEQIKKLASQFGTEMKNRYDLLFASQLVAKMNESGLLKDDVAKRLLEDKK